MNEKIYNILLEEYERIKSFKEPENYKIDVRYLDNDQKKNINNKLKNGWVFNWGFIQIRHQIAFNAWKDENLHPEIIELDYSDYLRFIINKDKVENLLRLYKRKKERD